jgi:hypothetical protein
MLGTICGAEVKDSNDTAMVPCPQVEKSPMSTLAATFYHSENS